MRICVFNCLRGEVVNELLKKNQRIFVAGSSNEPSGLLSELRTLDLPSDLEFVQFPLSGYNSVDFTQFNDSSNLTTFFMTPSLKNADSSRLHFLPMQMRAVFDYLEDNIDVAMFQVACDRDGNLRLGPNVDFVEAALRSASVRIAELNKSLVAPLGCMSIDPEQIDFLYESERPLFQMPAPELDVAAKAIGTLVSDLIADGSCIQTGIGAIPTAILSQLSNKNDLGMHGGLVDDAGMNLITAGNLSGRSKTLDRDKHVVGMALGSQKLYDWLGSQQDVLFKGANYTHEVSVIRQIDDFVSINSAVEIDLYGQVNAEFAGGRQLSGTGGSVDFMRAAKSSKRGKSIVAMNATAKNGSVSRIVPKVEMVTALRTDVDIVVTEFGVADLKNLSIKKRADALIEIAAPQFREELRRSKV